MIQLNLLPEVKLEFMRAERTKRLVTVISAIVVTVSVAILIILALVVMVFQKSYTKALTQDITKYSYDLQSTKDLNKILTVQNQLNSLSSLHQQKPDAQRVFPYIETITPADVTMSNITIDFEASTMTVNGSADSLSAVNKFVDTLKFTVYKQNGETQKAFSDVVLSTFGRGDKSATYSITLAFNPVIFDNTQDITLSVPDKVTTRSELEKANALFQVTQGSN